MDNYFQSKQFRELLQRYEKAAQTGDGGFFDADELSDLAEYYHHQGKDIITKQLLERAIYTFPGSTMPLVLMSRLALTNEFSDLEAPEYYLDQIIDKSDLEYFYAKVEIKIARKELEEANFMIEEKMEELDASDIDDFALDVALIFGDYDEFDYADHWLQLVSDTSLSDYKELKGRILVSKGLYQESEALFNELIDSDPYSAPYWNRLAMTQFMENKIHDSITSSEYSIAINPNDTEATLNKANGLYYLGNYEEAQKYYQRYGELDTTSETAELFQALCLLNMGCWEEALPHLEHAAEKAEKCQNVRGQHEVYMEMAFAYSHLGRMQESLQCLEKLFRLKTVDANELLVIKGHVYLENNHYTEAIECFKQALYDSQLNPFILFKMAVSVFDCGYLGMAKNVLQVLFNRTSDEWTDGYAYMARCCYELDEKEECRKYLAIAVEKNPDEASSMFADLYPEDATPADYLKTDPAPHKKKV